MLSLAFFVSMIAMCCRSSGVHVTYVSYTTSALKLLHATSHELSIYLPTVIRVYHTHRLTFSAYVVTLTTEHRHLRSLLLPCAPVNQPRASQKGSQYNQFSYL